MRSEGFPFIVWGSGGWTVFAWFASARRGRVASTRGASLIPCRWDLRCERVARVPCVALCHGDCCWAGRVGAALPWGSASRARRACTAYGAAARLLLGRSCGRRSAVGICVSRVYRVWRCAVGICVAGASCVYRGCRCAVGICVASASASRACTACGAVPLGSASRARRACTVGTAVPLGSALRARRGCAVCGAVPWGLLLGRLRGWRCAMGICVSGASRVWRVWRCAMGIAAGQVACAALCRGDLRLGRVACVACHSVWRCAVGIAAGQVVWVALCRGDLRLGRVACVACVALCHGDCCWAGRVGAAVPWGSASRARRVCGVRGAVLWGLLLGRSRGWRCAVGICVSGASRVWCGWRCAMGIAAGQVACVALCRGDLRLGRVACVACVVLCHGDCCWAGRVGGAVPWGSASRARRVCGVGGAVPWGLLLGVSRGWRCAMGIAAGRVAGAALCHGDCCWACRVGGAVSLGLLTRASWQCGWQPAFWRAKTAHFERPCLYRIVIFGFWSGSGGWGGPKRLLFKGRACTESSFLGFGTGPG